MYFSFCKPSILKWQYRIYTFSCFKFITGLWPLSFFFTKNKLLTNSSFDVWTFLMSPFFNIPFTSSSTNFPSSRLPVGWEGAFEWKGFKWNGIWYPFTMSKILGSCVIFIQALTKCFNLPTNGTSGILFDKNNLCLTWWAFLGSYWIGFSGFKSMLKKACCSAVTPTLPLLLTPCMSLVGMRLLLLLLVTIMEFTWSGFVRKNFCPSHFLGTCEGLKKRAFFWFCKNLFGLFLGFDSVSSVVPELFSEQIFVMFLQKLRLIF